MTGKLKYYDRINAYVERQLDAEAQEIFEKELQSDPELKKEYEAYLATLKVMDVLAYQTLEPQSPKRLYKSLGFAVRRSWMAAAAVLVMVVGGAFLWRVYSSGPNYVVAYYQQPLPDLVRGGEAALEEGVARFYAGQYSEAIIAFEKQAGLSEAHQLLLGHAYLLSQDYGKAARTYSVIAESREEDIASSARWHRILAYLEEGKRKPAEDELRLFLLDPDGLYYSQAQSLKEKAGF